MRKQYQCSVCGCDIRLFAGNLWQRSPMWIGSIRFGYCEGCDQNVTLLRDEKKTFVGTHTQFHSPATEAPQFPFNNNNLANIRLP